MPKRRWRSCSPTASSSWATGVSHSHGTYIEPSDPSGVDDVDLLGVYVAPVEYYLGFGREDAYERWESRYDCVFYELRKFVGLLLKSNPNVLSETRTLEDVIRELDGGLRELYGVRHRGLVLYSTHARGEADEGSDVDLLLLLEGQVQVGREIRRSSDLVASLSLESGRVLSLIPVSVEDYRASSDSYLVNARREGALLSPAAG